MDFTLALGELFTLVVYGHLILEQAELIKLGTTSSTQRSTYWCAISTPARWICTASAAPVEAQQHWALSAVRKPATDAERFDRIWQQIVSLSGSYEMNPDRPETRGAPGYPTDAELLAAHPQATIPRPGGAGAPSGSPGPPGRGSGSLSPRWDSTRIQQPLPARAA
jgi:hypothetical protein